VFIIQIVTPINVTIMKDIMTTKTHYVTLNFPWRNSNQINLRSTN